MKKTKSMENWFLVDKVVIIPPINKPDGDTDGDKQILQILLKSIPSKDLWAYLRDKNFTVSTALTRLEL